MLLVDQLGEALDGLGVHQVALVFLIMGATGDSPFALGVVFAAVTIPSFLVGPVAGALVDRWDRKRVMILCDIGRGLTLASIPAIILLGQTELREMLDRPALRQLAQRVTARYHLEPLSRCEIAAYVSHRLRVSGARSRLFPASTIPMLGRLSGGIPRLINLLCDRALLGTYIEGKAMVNRRILAKAASEVFGKDKVLATERSNLFRKMAAALVLLGGGSAVAYYALGLQAPSHERRVADAWAPPEFRAWLLLWQSPQ